MHRPQPVSTTHQMYLKALYRLSRTRPIGRVRDLARELDLTPGTVSTTLNRLQEIGLVERERYGGVVLTEPGTAVARCVIRRFETLRALLTEVFGVDAKTAELDACMMEHAVSPTTVNRIDALLEHLRRGESVDLESLADLNSRATSACSECGAARVCRAALLSDDPAAPDHEPAAGGH